MDKQIDLTKGGKCVVLGGHTGFVQEYASNPQIEFIKCKEIDGGLLAGMVKTDTKVAILTDGVPDYHYHWITSFCRRQDIPFLIRKSTQHIYETLKSFFPNDTGKITFTTEEIKMEVVKGKLTSLIPFVDWTKSNAENAKILMRKCIELKIKSTEASLAQWMSNQRLKQSGTAIPKSARPKLDISVELLDNMIKEIGDMRDFLIATCEENRILRAKVDKWKKIMEE